MTASFAPGRVNLIGEHTDYTGGLVLPVALEAGITIEAKESPGQFSLTSEGHDPLDVRQELPELDQLEPAWARYVLAAAERLGVEPWITGSVTSTLPAGGTGLSSSAALTCAALLLLGDDDANAMSDQQRLALAEVARQAEIDAVGVNIGVMDQAASLTCRRDHALMLDCHSLEVQHVPVPASLEIVVVHSGQPRVLADSAYNDRREACQKIEHIVGPLRTATLSSLEELEDPTLLRRARHVVTESQRVGFMAEALSVGDGQQAGEILLAGHASLCEDYEVSTPLVDEMVRRVAGTPGFYGARMTGGGFGGAIVAFCEPGAELVVDTWSIRVRPGERARLL